MLVKTLYKRDRVAVPNTADENNVPLGVILGRRPFTASPSVPTDLHTIYRDWQKIRSTLLVVDAAAAAAR